MSKRILVVDDDGSVRHDVEAMLERIRFDVTVAGNGSEALAAVRSASEDKRPFGLIIMDKDMPLIDGIKAAEMIRSDGNEVPMVIMTNDPSSVPSEWAARHRTVVIGKPPTLDDLYIAMNRAEHIRPHRQMAAA